MFESFDSSLVIQGNVCFMCKLLEFGKKVIKAVSLFEFA